MCGRERSSGFTMIELLITIAILGIILAFAVPSFQTMIENNRVTSEANTLLSAVNLARTEAIKRGAVVSVQHEGAGFGDGYCVVVGALGASADCATASGNDVLVREFEAPNAVTVTDNGAGLGGVSFDGRGFRMAPGIGGNFWVELEPPTCPAGDQRLRQVEVAPAGRASLSQGGCN